MIDLRSDTCSRPTEAMRCAMVAAEVRDDVYSDDPTVRLLEERTAALLGKEDAAYMVTGTMTNQVAIRAHTEPGDAVLFDQNAHVTFLRVALLHRCLAFCPVCFLVFVASSVQRMLALPWGCSIRFFPPQSLRP